MPTTSSSSFHLQMLETDHKHAQEARPTIREQLQLLQESNAQKREHDRIRRRAVFDRFLCLHPPPLPTVGLPGLSNNAQQSRNLEKRSRRQPRARSAHSQVSRRTSLLLDQLNTTPKNSEYASKGTISNSQTGIQHAARSRFRTVSPPRRKPERHQSKEDLGLALATETETSAPKLFKSFTHKSNKSLVRNALQDCCLAGPVHVETRKQILDALEKSSERHFLILFRESVYCRFRGLYWSNFDTAEALKIVGKGPEKVNNFDVDKLFKYSSESKQFVIIATTNHMSLKTDGFTLQPAFWSRKRNIDS